MSKATSAELRRRELAAIHAAKRQLALDEDTYRTMLFQVAGVRSAKSLDQAQRRAVLDRMRKAGAAHQPRKRIGRHPGVPHNLDKQAMLQKIEAQLADMKLPWSYADSIAKQQTGIAKVAWVRETGQFSAIIAALDVEATKRALLGMLDQLLQERGESREQLAARLSLAKGWHRNRKTLAALLERLSEEATA